VIPHVAVAQSTADIDWKNIELLVYGKAKAPASTLIALPDCDLQTLQVSSEEDGYRLTNDPLAGKVNWRVRAAFSNYRNSDRPQR
jgi:alpha-D-xyloside xylohydrolase